jgi:hypothetical protein
MFGSQSLDKVVAISTVIFCSGIFALFSSARTNKQGFGTLSSALFPQQDMGAPIIAFVFFNTGV